MNYRYGNIFIIIFISLFLFVFGIADADGASAPAIEWKKYYGGSAHDIPESIQQTTDGGYIVAGWSLSNDGDISGNHGGRDVLVFKLNAKGEIVWQKSLGGSGEDIANYVRQTKDGGYIVAGTSSSNDGDLTQNRGEYDAWVIKLDSGGEILWQRPFGGSKYDEACSIQETTDGGYIFVGYLS